MPASLLRALSTPLARICPATLMPLPRAARGHAAEEPIELLSSSASSASSSRASSPRLSPARAPRPPAKRRARFEGLKASVTSEAAQAHSDGLERERLAWVQLVASTSRARADNGSDDDATSHRAAKGKGKAAAPARVRKDASSLKAPARPRADGAAKRGRPRSSRGVGTSAAQRARAHEVERTRLETGLEVFAMATCAPFLGGRKPAVAVTACPFEAAELLACVPRGVPLSVDAEWPYDPRTHVAGKLSLLQIGSPGMVLLLQIGRMGCIPDGLRELMADESSWKYGVNIAGDARKLLKDWGVSTRSLLELSTVAKLANPERWAGRQWMIALRDLTRIYVHRRLLKEESVRSSNWSLMHLNDRQVEYAACDVVAGTAIFRKLVPRLDTLLKERREEASAASTTPGWFQAAAPASDVQAQLATLTVADASLDMSAYVRALLQAQLTHVVRGAERKPLELPTALSLVERQAQAQQALRDKKRAPASSRAARSSSARRSPVAAAAPAVAAAAQQRTMNDEAALLAAARMSDALRDDVEAAAHRHGIKRVATSRRTAASQSAGDKAKTNASARDTVKTVAASGF